MTALRALQDADLSPITRRKQLSSRGLDTTYTGTTIIVPLNMIGCLFDVIIMITIIANIIIIIIIFNIIIIIIDIIAHHHNHHHHHHNHHHHKEDMMLSCRVEDV